MSICVKTPWHRASFERFLHDTLPQLLAERLPLVGYQVAPEGPDACNVEIALRSSVGNVQVRYTNIPCPNEEGVFAIAGDSYVVLPIATSEALDTADILCVGEQLYADIEARLGQAPADLPWDESMARAWLPLDAWIEAFLSRTAQKLEQTNWLARHTHLRSIWVAQRESDISASEFGRVCPFETPEGPNIGRILRVATGAEICDGKLVVIDPRPEAGLGLSASMIPLLEHNDPNRLLMGANMTRQWVPQSTAEPALVQTGNEPDAPDFWTGRNLLTAFVSWGADTFADGIVVSESCARRFDTPYALEPGDKMSNRYGSMGVVGRVLPDDEMPHLPDGTPVDLVYSFFGLNVRMNFGQVREAAWGNVAQAAGAPLIAPPFHAPSADELRRRLIRAGLPQTGMVRLTMGPNGPELEHASTVGWVYWGRLFHLAQSKVKVTTERGLQRQGEMECYTLRDIGAFESLREALNTCAGSRPGADRLAEQLAAGPVTQADPPTPLFVDLARRLRMAGVALELDGEKLRARWSPPQGDTLKLARPVAHPWLHERELAEIGVPVFPEASADQAQDLLLTEYAALLEANERLSRMLESQTPPKLVENATAHLQARVDAFFEALLRPEHLRLSARQLFSARTVIAPGADLELDQVALADEIAWALFAPLVVRELGDRQAVEARSVQAAAKLDEVMARSWVIVNRAPTLSPTALIAFHPVRDPGHVIRLHPLVCNWLDADFDGDQVAVFMPVTEAGQYKAGEKLSVSAHLRRDQALIASLIPSQDALWGLARLSLSESGRQEIARLAGGVAIDAPKGVITQETLAKALQAVLARDGIDAALVVLERLNRRGFEVAKRSGASMSPFLDENLPLVAPPESDDARRWETYTDELTEQVLSITNYADDNLGPQLLAVSIRARGRSHLLQLIGPRGPTGDGDNPTVVRHSLVEGLSTDELYACVAGARKGLAQLARRWDDIGHETHTRYIDPGRFTLLARARRARQPGIVFARAAASDEVDPLTDVDARLMVGLPIEE
ncbi:MAG: hypothetical protein JW934_06385 [Anaerolineae bacterium]|nr:hypothetical protein [Anaerolineae bacterium]